jgi:diadenosine tetraphosphatase ApaH/serine/threonine PP2A family protein phosphatase
MRIAIFSDVHSNWEALSTVVEYCRGAGVDRYICLGDVIGYGADPNRCCDLIRSIADVTLLGNHDAAVIGVMDTSYYYKEARDALLWTREQLSPANFRWLYSLPYSFHFDNLGFYHSAPIQPSGFYYVVTTSDADLHNRIAGRLHEFNFVGHSHLTNAYVLGGRKARDASGRECVSLPERKWIINVGSVGQPRDRDPRSCFGIFDTDSQSFEHIRLEYDVEAAATRILGAGLARKFAKRLFTGT